MEAVKQYFQDPFEKERKLLNERKEINESIDISELHQIYRDDPKLILKCFKTRMNDFELTLREDKKHKSIHMDFDVNITGYDDGEIEHNFSLKETEIMNIVSQHLIN